MSEAKKPLPLRLPVSLRRHFDVPADGEAADPVTNDRSCHHCRQNAYGARRHFKGTLGKWTITTRILQNSPKRAIPAHSLTPPVMAEKNPTVIGYGHIKERRLKQIRVASCGGRFVGEFVPFYFCPRSPMLYTTNKGATGRPVGCQRTIRASGQPGERGHRFGPSVGGERRERGGVSHLVRLDAGCHQDADRMDWAAIRATDWRGKTHQKSAEFLVADFFPWTGIHAIGCHNSGCGQAGAGFGKLSTPSSGGDRRAGVVLLNYDRTDQGQFAGPRRRRRW